MAEVRQQVKANAVLVGSKVQAAAKTRKPSRKIGGVESASVSTHEKVALLAYKYWEERGRQGGSSEEDWYRAEKDVLSRASRENS